MFVSTWNKRILVRGFQYRLIAGNLLYLLAVVLTFLVVLFAPVVTVLTDHSAPIGQREAAAFQLLALHERIWFAIPVLFALCLFHSALVSHRIAGPLVRFKQICADMARGDLSINFRVRNDDYLHQEAETVTEMARSLGKRIQAVQDGYREMSATLPQMLQAIGRTGDEETAVLAGKLGTQLDALGLQLRQFHLPEQAAEPTVQPKTTQADQVATTV